jgi:hypothetical protein
MILPPSMRAIRRQKCGNVPCRFSFPQHRRRRITQTMSKMIMAVPGTAESTSWDCERRKKCDRFCLEHHILDGQDAATAVKRLSFCKEPGGAHKYQSLVNISPRTEQRGREGHSSTETCEPTSSCLVHLRASEVRNNENIDDLRNVSEKEL